MFRIFEAIKDGIENTVCNGLDLFMDGFDKFAEFTYDICDTITDGVDKLDDIRSSATDIILTAEYAAKQTKDSLYYIKETGDLDELKYLAHSITECGKVVQKTTIKMSDEIKAVVECYNTVKGRLKVLTTFYKISDEEALMLLKENNLYIDCKFKEFEFEIQKWEDK